VQSKESWQEDQALTSPQWAGIGRQKTHGIMEYWNIEDQKWIIVVFYFLILAIHKKDLIPRKPSIPTLHYSNTPWHSFTA
jgi:hypothetical protein